MYSLLVSVSCANCLLLRAPSTRSPLDHRNINTAAQFQRASLCRQLKAFASDNGKLLDFYLSKPAGIKRGSREDSHSVLLNIYCATVRFPDWGKTFSVLLSIQAEFILAFMIAFIEALIIPFFNISGIADR
jgi:hypothetical protein